MYKIDIKRTVRRRRGDLEGNAVYKIGTADFRTRIDLFGQRIFAVPIEGKCRGFGSAPADGNIWNLFPVRVVRRAVGRQVISRNLVAVFRRIKPADEFPARTLGSGRCTRQYLAHAPKRPVGRCPSLEVLVERHRHRHILIPDGADEIPPNRTVIMNTIPVIILEPEIKGGTRE